jgi:hypothetical protein
MPLPGIFHFVRKYCTIQEMPEHANLSQHRRVAGRLVRCAFGRQIQASRARRHMLEMPFSANFEPRMSNQLFDAAHITQGLAAIKATSRLYDIFAIMPLLNKAFTKKLMHKNQFGTHITCPSSTQPCATAAVTSLRSVR